MVDLDEAIVGRYEIKGEVFEILIDPRIVKYLKEGKEVDVANHMAVEEIFKDAKKGTKQSPEKLKEFFDTDDIGQVARTILQKGQVQLTTEQRRIMAETKRKQVATIIARNAINPQTRTPHPLARIEAAMEEARVRIDPFKSAESQVQEVLDALRPLIPIRFENAKIAIKLSGEDYGRCYEDLLHFGKITREEWQNDGHWVGILEIPAGMQTDLFEKIGHKTKGKAETKILK
ncbi:MAG: ribosome assembly factor SBDS [Candidatus Thermoplasmatota archaeon]|jgi:ribosome maturation protein SDO1|nr:ribosome assembly factor SBDS [Candidatus Sysuiplasma jiujiangense]MBX8639512.1 ribosome assembly factor SBDS [Candidatus Sysuiplasma jiujiangense]MBX8641254.1 ribosome assembly factor SBDS [Candidatus Sysuiplasma jiujiangense]MCL5253157.1 ribosome assembly factor SBDS [Candidatus Thermoplasmatota archaeon]